MSSSVIFRHSLSISIGYFASDTLLILASFMDLWPLYVFHHFISLLATCLTVFGNCDAYLTSVACFFIVEFTTFSLQGCYWLENLKLEKQPGLFKSLYNVCRQLTFWLWVAFRNIPPMFLTYVGYVVATNPVEGQPSYCAIPCVGAGVGITLFCWGVFASAIYPAYVKPTRDHSEQPRKID